MNNRITINRLAINLKWSPQKLNDYLKKHTAKFNSIRWTESCRTSVGFRNYIDEVEFYRIKSEIETKEKAIVANNADKFINQNSSIESSKKQRRSYRGSNNIGTNGMTFCENTLRKGKVFITNYNLVNPVKFANFDGNKYKTNIY